MSPEQQVTNPFGSTPIPTPGMIPPPGVVPDKPKFLRLVIILVASLAVISVIVLIIFKLQQVKEGATTPAGLPILSEQQIKELEAKYGYDITYKPNVSPTEEFDIQANYTYNDCKENTCSDAVVLYGDAGLTKRLRATILSNSTYRSSNNSDTITVHPPLNSAFSEEYQYDGYGLAHTEVNRESKAIGGTNNTNERWSLGETYFLVQRLDQDGKILERPKVTLFTIKPDNKVLAATDLTTNIDSNGAVNFSWNPVNGAETYYVLMIKRDANSATSSVDAVKYTILAQTKETSVNMAKHNGDDEQAKKAMSSQEMLTGPLSWTQNHGFEQVLDVKDQDSFYNEDGTNTLPNGRYIPLDNGIRPVSFAVVAVRGEGKTQAFSPAREIDGSALLAQIPIGLAFNQSLIEKAKSKKYALDDFEQLLKAVPITMADGHTASKTPIYDSDKIVIDTFKNSKTGKDTDDIKISYKVQGTYITDSSHIYVDHGSLSKDDIKSKIDTINNRNIAASPKIGALPTNYLIQQQSLKLDAETKEEREQREAEEKKQQEEQTRQEQAAKKQQELANLVASVKYPVNGSTDLVKFIAANIMADNYEFNIKDYYDDPTVGIWDATYEAITQNPYISTASVFMRFSIRGDIMRISLSGISRQDATKRREDLYNKVQSVNSQIIHSDMSDRDKALAINQWLAKNATYDYDALKVLEKSEKSGDYSEYYTQFPYAWNGLGTSIFQRGVCASYADAFKALADVANLKAIVVSGTDIESGGAHAWNKVFMDGKWSIVDPTWNDGEFEQGGSLTQYFGLTDIQANRVESVEFMVDRFIPDYAAN